MMRRRKAFLAVCLIMVAAISLLVPSTVMADKWQVDSDISAGGVQHQVDLTAEAGSTVSTSAQIVLDYQGGHHLLAGDPLNFTGSSPSLPAGYTVAPLTGNAPNPWNNGASPYIVGSSTITFTAPSVPDDYTYPVHYHDAIGYASNTLNGGDNFVIHLTVTPFIEQLVDMGIIDLVEWRHRDPCPETLTVDFHGVITTVPTTVDGVLCRDCYAHNPDELHLLFIESGTRVLDSQGNPVRLIEIAPADAPELPLNTVLVRQAYDFQPSGTTFDKQASLTLGYHLDDLPEDAERVLMAYHSAGATWNEIETKSTQVADIGTLTGTVGHFTVFATLAEVPAFEVSNLSVTPSRTKIGSFLTFAVRTGEQVEVSVDVANAGKHQAGAPVVLEMNGNKQGNHDVYLSPGESEQVVYTLAGNAPGRHVVAVEGLTGEFTTSLWINWALIIGLSATLAAVILLAVFGIRWYRRTHVA